MKNKKAIRPGKRIKVESWGVIREKTVSHIGQRSGTVFFTDGTFKLPAHLPRIVAREN